MKDENKDTTDLMCTQNMAANSEVYLVDHAWTFRFQDAVDTLKSNPNLIERLQKMLDEVEKQDLPEQEQEEEKKGAEPARTPAGSMENKFLAAVNAGGVVFDLDNLDISSLRNLP